MQYLVCSSSNKYILKGTNITYQLFFIKNFLAKFHHKIIKNDSVESNYIAVVFFSQGYMEFLVKLVKTHRQ